jgi:hypothetical protein
LIVNSGYYKWGTGVLGFSWNYIHDQAKSCNTVLINNQNHQEKRGDGLENGFIIDGVTGYAVGLSGSAITNGEHRRTLHMSWPSAEASGYWVLFDEVFANTPGDDAYVYLHPRSTDVAVVEDGRQYRWNVQRWTEGGVNVDLYLATLPQQVGLYDGVQADKSNSVETKFLRSVYPTDGSGRKRIVTVAMPSDGNHPAPTMSSIDGSHYSGALVEHLDGATDYALESDSAVWTSAGNSEFRADYFFRREVDGSTRHLFGRRLLAFVDNDESPARRFSSDTPVDLFLQDTIGKIQCEGATVTFHYPEIEQVMIDGIPATTVEKAGDSIIVEIPSGVYDLQLIVGGGADTTAPTEPSGLVATLYGYRAVDLTWSAATDNVGVTGYVVRRNNDVIDSVSGTTYRDTGLLSSTEYCYTVAAYDAAGNAGGECIQECVVTSEVPQPGEVVWAVNCGGSAFEGADGVSYAADEDYLGGKTYTTPDSISNTTDDLLYRSERYQMEGYSISLPAGVYEVTLKLAEIYWTRSGRRVFDVDVEGISALTQYDIYAEAGHDNAHDVVVENVTVDDGSLDLTFSSSTNYAKVSALVVRFVSEN